MSARGRWISDSVGRGDVLRRSWVASVHSAICALALVLAMSVTACSDGVAASAQAFAPSSPFSAPIPPGAAVDPNSQAMLAGVASSGVIANLVEFGIPIYEAGPDTPKYSVMCRMTGWGKCPFDGYQVPIPDSAHPHSGSDGAMVVIDRLTRQVFEFWQAKDAGDHWATSWGGITSLDGSGWGDGATASGASRLGGVIRIDEIARGNIPHALVVSTNAACAEVFRAPAVATDGVSTRPNCLPQGARIRLDPAVDLDTLDLAPAVRAVARAFQTYGAYVVDTGGAAMAVTFELDPTAGPNSIGGVYQRAGLRWDYDAMPGVPWDRLQVLA